MSDLIVIQPQVTELTVTEDVNQVVVSSVGVQGPTGATGATGPKGDTGDQGPSGVIAVTAPITNSGTSTSANIGVSAGSTSTAGVLQLTDSTSSTSTTTAATPNAVKTVYDNALIKPFLANVSGLYYKTPSVSFTPTTIVNNRAYYQPIFINQTTTFDRIAIRTSSFSGTSTVRLGIYNNSNGQPSTVLLDAGTVTATAATTIYEITISQSLAAGMYWLVFCQQGTAPTTPAYSGNAGGQSLGNALISGAVLPSGQDVIGYTQSSVTGAFATAGSLTASVIMPYVWIRAV